MNRRRALVEGAIIGCSLLAVAGCGGSETVQIPPSTEAATPNAKAESSAAGTPKARSVAARSGSKVPVSSRRQRQKEKAGKPAP